MWLRNPTADEAHKRNKQAGRYTMRKLGGSELILAVLSHEYGANLLACQVHERPRLIKVFVRQFEHRIWLGFQPR